MLFRCGYPLKNIQTSFNCMSVSSRDSIPLSDERLFILFSKNGVEKICFKSDPGKQRVTILSHILHSLHLNIYFRGMILTCMLNLNSPLPPPTLVSQY